MKQFVEPAVRGEPVKLASGGRLPRDYTHVADVASMTVRVVGCPDDADRVFFAATGGPLVTAAQAARLVAELVPGSSIEISDDMTPDDEVEASFRGVLSIEDLPSMLRPEGSKTSLPGIDETSARTLEARVDLVERRIIEDSLRRNAHRRQATAHELGISRVTLYNKMKKFGMLN